MRALLLLADIGGYTRFMKLHRMSLAHAQENTDRLLKAVVDAAPRLRLADLEGDAAFLYVAHDVAPRAMSPKIKGFVQPKSWFVDFSPISMTP